MVPACGGDTPSYAKIIWKRPWKRPIAGWSQKIFGVWNFWNSGKILEKSNFENFFWPINHILSRLLYTTRTTFSRSIRISRPFRRVGKLKLPKWKDKGDRCQKWENRASDLSFYFDNFNFPTRLIGQVIQIKHKNLVQIVVRNRENLL